MKYCNSVYIENTRHFVYISKSLKSHGIGSDSCNREFAMNIVQRGSISTHFASMGHISSFTEFILPVFLHLVMQYLV